VGDLIWCDVEETAHGSDHLAVCTSCRLTSKDQYGVAGKWWKHAHWDKIREAVAEKLRSNPQPEDNTNPNCYIQYILDLVEPAIEIHVPVSKPSPNVKRWWTEDLTKLRKDYEGLMGK
jgi:hypothetical protein